MVIRPRIRIGGIMDVVSYSVCIKSKAEKMTVTMHKPKSFCGSRKHLIV